MRVHGLPWGSYQLIKDQVKSKNILSGRAFSPVFSYFCKSMVENKRNSSSVILVISLMFVFFSFVHSEREKNIPGSSISSIVISSANNSSLQAIIVPVTSTPEISFSRINTSIGKYIFPDCTICREIIVNKQNFSHFCSCRLKFLSKKPVIGITFLQKVPQQETEDDILPVT